MSDVSDAFVSAFGAPDPAAPSGLRFPRRGSQVHWDRLHNEVGSGWFRDGFLYLFGEGLDALGACLDAWSFLVPPCSDRVIVGRNAYGAILVLDNPSTPALEKVHVLDPFTVTYTGDSTIQLVSLIGRALPENELRTFLDDSAYRVWMKEQGLSRLRIEDVLGIKIPKGLGGKLESSNLQLDGIVDYYQSTAPIYADAFEQRNKQS